MILLDCDYMSSPEGYRYKSPEQLAEQFTGAQEKIGNKPEHSLVPPSSSAEEIMQMPLEEIKQKYARRYEMYVQILQDQKYYEGKDDDDVYFFEEDLKNLRKWLSALNGLDRYIQNHHEGVETTLREKQIDVFEDLRNFIEAGGKEGYIKLPTGVGKTVLFVELIEALNLRTLIIVPTTILVDQTENKMGEFAEDIDVGKITGKAKEYGQQVTIITYDSFVKQVETGNINPEEIDCLILDEAHVALSDKRKEIVSKFENSLKLGFTATPQYSEKKTLSDLLPAEIHSMSIKEAVEANLLCSFSSILARTTVDLSKVSITSTGEYTEVELEKAVNVEGRNIAAVKMYEQAFEGKSAITYCVGIKHAEAVAKVFSERGIVATVISGKTQNSEEILKKFKNGEIKVLCNADILIAGFDEPRASVCFNLRPTLSRVVAEQRGGRVLRLDKKDKSKHAIVVDFIDSNIPERLFPVLFATVAGAAEITDFVREGNEYNGGGVPRVPTFADISIEGLDVITDSEVIMKVISEHESERKEKVEKISFEDLKKEVRTLGIKSSAEYHRISKMKSHWPSSPSTFYVDWVSWDDLFEREVVKKLSLEDLKREVRALKIRSYDAYKVAYKTQLSWPSNPATTYPDWVSWPDLFGREVVKKLSLEDLKKEVRIADIHDSKTYNKVCKSKSHWPSSPHTFYNDWINWDDLFGREVTEKISFEDLKKEVSAMGVSTREEYKTISKKKPHWPSNPDKFYSDWVNWADFMGREVTEKISFEDLKKEVRTECITSQREYKRFRPTKPHWPADPFRFYKEWISWDDLFGREVVKKISLEDLKKEVREMEIRNSMEYQKVSKMKPHWPASPDTFYPEWRGYPDLFGKEIVEKISFEDLKKELKTAGIKGQVAYKKIYKTKPHWPSNPDTFYGVSWRDLWEK